VRPLRLLIEYDGTDFAGWQRQQGQRTVQGAIEDVLAQMTGEKVPIQGAGRTDAGVHAAGQVANLVLPGRIPNDGLQKGMNGLLPRDVAILDVADAAPDFNARFSARGKVYRYQIWNHPVRSALHDRWVWHCRRPLDIDRMREAAALLVGEHDFRAFRAADCERRTTRRLIRRLDVERQGALVTIEVEATAFLKNMVRILAGTLWGAGRGDIDGARIARALTTGERTASGMTAPAQGLTLVRVIY
jgi:tRNA pseudouridine38-40 synthase